MYFFQTAYYKVTYEVLKPVTGTRASAGVHVIVLTSSDSNDVIRAYEQELRTRPSTIHAIAVGVSFVTL